MRQHWHLIPILLCCLFLTSGVSAELETDEYNEPEIMDYEREHWAFQPIERPPLPTVQDSTWPQTGIDHFILRSLKKEGLRPAPTAPRNVLLRRLKFDLLGIPPTRREVSRFQQDRSPDAWQRLVDRMLASPGYGERWAQHWLDLARFAETDGFEFDKTRKGAWKYRQWVIQAFNDGMPYDRFVRLQLTGDLTGNPQDAVATMFCLAGPDMPDINEQDLRRHDRMNELASTVGAVLLGLQTHCAQCHDHKYDPISQADFYRLRGIFEAAVPPLKRDQHVLQLAEQPAPVQPWLYLRGELGQQGPAVRPLPPRIVSRSSTAETFRNTNPRVAFANWLFDDHNPLTARVIANRIWQFHFGRSLTENPSDFGSIAGGPSHPELLDWLASELKRHAWDLKQLHRTILLSATYQQSSYAQDRNGKWAARRTRSKQLDPSGYLYSRFPRKRLEGEVIRDAMLAVSGQLSRSCGGTSVMPPLPDELRATLLKGQWNATDDPERRRRRSIYIFARRNLRYPLFDVFDRPDAGSSCARRDRSTTAIQALHLLNGDLTFRSAKQLSKRLLRELDVANGSSHPSDDAKRQSRLIKRLFLTLFARKPTQSETTAVAQVLNEPGEPFEDNLLVACVALLNTNEFIYID